MKRSFKVILSIAIIIAFVATSLGLTRVAVSSIKLNSSNVKILVGKTYTLQVTITPTNATNKKLTFSSGNKNIATVDKNGKIKGIIAGKTVITVTSQSNKKAVAKCNVSISQSKHLNITIVAYNPYDNLVPDGTPTQKLLEKRYNITIKHPKVDISKEEQRRLYFATGEKFDVLLTNAGTENWALAEQNIIRPISEEMLRKNMPVFMSEVDEWSGNPRQVTLQMSYNGKYWGIPYPVHDRYGMITAIRADWMKNVGITKIPETLDEFHDLLYKFTYNDPDKNGKNDTYGRNGGHDWFGFNPIDDAFGVRKGAYYDWNGKVVYANTTPQFKEFLKTLNKWYKEGILDPTFVTEKGILGVFASNRVGVVVGHPWHWTVNGANWEKYIKDRNSNAQLAYSCGLKSIYDGKKYALGMYPNWLQAGIFFGKNASDEIVQRFMQICEDLTTDWDFYLQANWGTLGEDYEIVEDGVLVRTKKFQDNANAITAQKGFGAFAKGFDNGYPNYFEKTNRTADREMYKLALTANILYEGIAFTNIRPNQILIDKRKDIETIADEFYVNAITGSIDIDSNWESYIDKLNKAGLTEVLKEFEKLIVR